MAAHAVDEEVDIELEDNIRAETASTRAEKGATYEIMGLPFPLPPPLPVLKNNYSMVSTFTCLFFLIRSINFLIVKTS